jgi:prepilin-type N-terminal cleavage/methylation domain-containing protein
VDRTVTAGTPRGERGFTLVEVLLVSMLFLVVLGATLTSFNAFEANNAQAKKVADQVEHARTGLDQFARQARNLGKRVTEETIFRATANDIVFQTSDPTKTWVRYCLAPGSPRKGKLWMFENPNGLGGTGTCNDNGWTRKTLVADHLTNEDAGRPLFQFSCVRGAADCTSSSAVYEKITGFHADLLVDLDPNRPPRAMRVSSAVYLRNQNEHPTAAFSWRPMGTQKVLLNGSSSSDPEGRTLRYYWFKTTAPTFRCDQGPPAASFFWQGVTLTYTFTTETPGTTVPFVLVVCDPGDLQSIQTQTVTVPS